MAPIPQAWVATAVARLEIGLPPKSITLTQHKPEERLHPFNLSTPGYMKADVFNIEMVRGTSHKQARDVLQAWRVEQHVPFLVLAANARLILS